MPMPNDIVQGGLYRREASVISDSINKEKRTVSFCWSTGARVLRVPWFDDPFYEELSMNPEHIRLHRLNQGAPFLRMHRSYDLADSIGVHERAWIEGDKGYAEVRFSKRSDVEEIWGEVCDGILRNISVGYKTYKIKETRGKGERPVHRAVDWEPFENSLVLVNADADAQIRSSEAKIFYPIHISRRSEDLSVENGEKEKVVNTPKEETRAVVNSQSAPGASLESHVKPKPELDAKEIEAKARKLAAEINTLCDAHGVDSQLRQDLITNARTYEDAALKVLEFVGKKNDSVRVQNPHNIELGRSEKEVSLEGLKNALHHRCNPEIGLSDNGRRYRSYSLMDYAMEAAGIRERGRFSKHEVVTRAFHSTSDFPELLGDVANTLLKQSYQAYIQKQNFWELVKIRSTNDFRPFRSARIGEIPTLEYLPEGAEYKYSSISEEGHEWKIHTYGRAFGLSRQAIINDNLDAFEKMSAWGYAAARLESKLFWSIFNENQKIVSKGDDAPLFDKTHNNIAKKGGTISVETLSSARTAMMRQKGLDAREGDILDIHAEYLIIPPELQTLAEQYMTGGEYPVNPEGKNTFKGAYKTIVSSWLKSPEDWYLAASKSQGIDLIEMAYLDGVREPYVAWDEDFSNDTFKVKARLDVGCRAIDYRGFYKVPAKGQGVDELVKGNK